MIIATKHMYKKKHPSKGCSQKLHNKNISQQQTQCADSHISLSVAKIKSLVSNNTTIEHLAILS